MSSSVSAKAPDRAALGLAAARRRWGAPRLVRLDGLDDAEREAIFNAVQARRAAKRAAQEAGFELTAEARLGGEG